MRMFVNQAQAAGLFEETPVGAISNLCTVTQQPPCSCVCQWVNDSFYLEDKGSCIETCYVYHTGAQPIFIMGQWAVRAGYGIWLKYTGCSGESHIETRTGSVLFSTLPSNFSPQSFNVCLQNPVHAELDCRCVTVRFRAILCSPLEAAETA